MKRIKRFGVMQTAKFAAVLYFVMSLVIVVPMFGLTSMLSSAFSGGDTMFPFGGYFILIMPFIYALLGFITTAIACAVYNLLAGFIGGIEIELED